MGLSDAVGPPGWPLIRVAMGMRWACAFALVVLLGVTVTAAQELSAVPKIVDGDTVYLAATRVRLNGIDAPETDQICLDARTKPAPCGLEAKNRLVNYSAGRPWTCKVS